MQRRIKAQFSGSTQTQSLYPTETEEKVKLHQEGKTILTPMNQSMSDTKDAESMREEK